MRDWGIIVIKAAGHGLSKDIKKGLSDLNQAGTSKSAYITVRAEQDGHYTDFTVTDSTAAGNHLAIAANGAVNKSSDQESVLSKNAMQSFFLDTMKNYPARHYMISFETHGRLLRAAIGDIQEAMAAAGKECGHTVDVMVLDACFMAQIESATAFQDVAKVLVASQEGMDKWRDAAKLAQAVDAAPMDAIQVGQHLVANQQDYTLSAFDLSKVHDVNKQVQAFGAEIKKVQEDRGMAEIRHSARKAQHFYTIGRSYPNPYHNTVDFPDFLSRVVDDPYLAGKFPTLVASASALQKSLVVGPNQLVFAENHVNAVRHTPQLDYYDVRNAHGVSLHMPTTPPTLRDTYTHFPHSQFDKETQWDSVIDHLTSSKSPTYLAWSTREDMDGAILAGLNVALNEALDWRNDRRSAHGG